MAARESLHEYYLHQHSNIEHYLELCRVNAEVELVHELRLSIKKLRAFNKLAELLCTTDSVERIRIKKKVNRLYKLAGRIRDTQVQMELLVSFEAQTGAKFPEFSKWLLKREEKQIANFSRSPQEVIPRATSGFTHRKVGKALAFTDDDTVKSCASNVLTGLFNKAQKLAAGNIHSCELHRIRIICKQMRYILNSVLHNYDDFSFDAISVDSLRLIEATTGLWHDNLIRVELLNVFLEKFNKEGNDNMQVYRDLSESFQAQLDQIYIEATRIVQDELLKDGVTSEIVKE